jgi:hypothetical protein
LKLIDHRLALAVRRCGDLHGRDTPLLRSHVRRDRLIPEGAGVPPDAVVGPSLPAERLHPQADGGTVTVRIGAIEKMRMK